MNTTDWKWFRYDEIFDIKKGFYNKKPDDNPQGDIPFIGATDSNNGITSHSDLDTIENTTKTGDDNNAPMSEKIFANCLAVTNNGSVGYAYYQEKPFTCTHDVNPLYIKKEYGIEMNKYLALFLCTLIEKERFRWAYGRKWRPTRMPSSLIKLPITSEGKPDWQYMEDFVKNIITQLPKKAKEVWMNTFDTTPIHSLNDSESFDVTTWKAFRIGDYFDKPYKATAYNAQDLEACNAFDTCAIPYITRTDINNGLKGFYKIEEHFQIEKGNALTLGDTTATIYYQENDFICGDHIVVLRGKHLNKYIGLFLVTLLNREKYRYNYGRAFLKDTLADTILKLPAMLQPDGTYIPDWQFMEDYIKSLPYSKNL